MRERITCAKQNRFHSSTKRDGRAEREKDARCGEVKKQLITRKNEFGYFVINYHFYCAVNPNPKFIARNIKLFRFGMGIINIRY